MFGFFKGSVTEVFTQWHIKNAKRHFSCKGSSSYRGISQELRAWLFSQKEQQNWGLKRCWWVDATMRWKNIKLPSHRRSPQWLAVMPNSEHFHHLRLWNTFPLALRTEEVDKQFYPDHKFPRARSSTTPGAHSDSSALPGTGRPEPGAVPTQQRGARAQHALLPQAPQQLTTGHRRAAAIGSGQGLL